MSILKVKNLYVKYKTKDTQTLAVNNVSLDIKEQDSIGIVGESGSGKTTLIMAILRLLSNRITEVKGEILFDGVNLLRLPDNELTQIRWKEIAAVFQKSMNALSPVHKIGNQM